MISQSAFHSGRQLSLWQSVLSDRSMIETNLKFEFKWDRNWLNEVVMRLYIHSNVVCWICPASRRVLEVWWGENEYLMFFWLREVLPNWPNPVNQVPHTRPKQRMNTIRQAPDCKLLGLEPFESLDSRLNLMSSVSKACFSRSTRHNRSSRELTCFSKSATLISMSLTYSFFLRRFSMAACLFFSFLLTSLRAFCSTLVRGRVVGIGRPAISRAEISSSDSLTWDLENLSIIPSMTRVTLVTTSGLFCSLLLFSVSWGTTK